MKSILFVFVLGLFSIGLQAQSCHASSAASCCSKSASAAISAANEAGIQVRKDVATGDISFHKKTSCTYSDHASYTEVKYDASNNQFVNKAPEFSSEAMIVPVALVSNTNKKMDCSKMTPTECAEKMAKGECNGHTAANSKASIATN